MHLQIKAKDYILSMAPDIRLFSTGITAERPSCIREIVIAMLISGPIIITAR